MTLKEVSAGYGSAEGDGIVGYSVLKMEMEGREGVIGVTGRECA